MRLKHTMDINNPELLRFQGCAKMVALSDSDFSLMTDRRMLAVIACRSEFPFVILRRESGVTTIVDRTGSNISQFE
jgi:hypothetical protein